MKFIKETVRQVVPAGICFVLTSCAALPTVLFEPQWTYVSPQGYDESKPNRFRQEAALQIDADNALDTCKKELHLTWASRRAEKADLKQLDACMAPNKRQNQAGCTYC